MYLPLLCHRLRLCLQRDLGWTTAALRAAAKDLKLSPAAAGSFQRGPAQLVEHFNARCNRQLDVLLQGMAPQLAGMRAHERVAAGAKLRLQMIVPYIGKLEVLAAVELRVWRSVGPHCVRSLLIACALLPGADSWPQALALQAQPASLLHSVRQYGEIADIIWRAAGDKSTDLNWYTKRGLLIGCYVSTELFMLTDCSPEYADTWAALDRRLQDVMTVGKAAGQAGSAAGAAADAAGSVLQQLSAVLGQRPHRP